MLAKVLLLGPAATLGTAAGEVKVAVVVAAGMAEVAAGMMASTASGGPSS